MATRIVLFHKLTRKISRAWSFTGLVPVALAAIFSFSAVQPVAAQCNPQSVFLRGDWGQARFSVEVVDTVAERAQGLMNRDAMPMSAGMIFVYEHAQSVAFWMKNTLIPLDMVFVDAAGTVQKVHHNAVPHDLNPIPGGDDILVVLEINGGLAKLMGITKGSQMQHPAFAADTAVWPCR